MINSLTINPLELPSVPLLDRKNLHRWRGVYFVIKDEQDILYIGQSSLVRDRWSQHQCLRLLNSDEKQRSRIHWLATNENLEQLEAAFIHYFHPPLNRYYPPLSPAQKPLSSSPLKVRRIVKREIDTPELPRQIAQAQKDSGKAISEICEAVGFSRTYWYQIVNGREGAIAEETLRKIEEVLGVDFGVRFDS